MSSTRTSNSCPAQADPRATATLEAENLARLRRQLIKLVFKQYGQSKALDACLTRLHRQLRDGSRRADIDQTVGDVLEEMLQLPQAQPGSQQERQHAGAVLAALGLKIDWPDPAAAGSCERLRELRDESAAIHKFADLVNRCLTHDAEEVWRDAARRLNRILDRLEAPGAEVAQLRARLARVSSQGDFISAAEGLLNALSRDGGSAAGDATPTGPSEAAHTLHALIETLSLPEDSQNEAAGLVQRLAKSPSEPMRRLVGAVANLLADVQDHLHGQLKDVTGFLKTTQLRLQGLHSLLLSSADIRQEALRDGERLESVISDHLAGIRTSMDEAADLATLKRAISGQLASIDTDVASYIESERRRAAETERAVCALTTQLNDLESQTLQLRDALAEEQTKALNDALTGIPNRLYYEERLREEVERWRQDGQPLATVVIDIDLFKGINDRYGHHAGDKVLATVAQQLSSQIRASDFFARYGGEEFVLLLPGTTLADATRLADKLRRNIEECRFRYGELPVPVTISCGVSEFRSGDAAEDAFKRADEALYAAKRGGRNRTCSDPAAEAA